jgi:crotonobetainyl-CoA:carnitine CoA-transferase CaiB-like acyl-CoA transferase
MSSSYKPLKGIRVLSLSLNLPGPAALLRCKQMGATCVKLEPPGGDPMQLYQAQAYQDLHAGVRIIQADLKNASGQKILNRELVRTHVLLTSFRPSALNKLGLGWRALHRLYPELNMVSIVGAKGAAAETPGHDLTYLADAGLVPGLELPATLFADMGGSLMASEAVLASLLRHKMTGKSSYQQVALADSASWLALPRTWGLTQPKGVVGGAFSGYRVYACKDGRVAVAALEPHFASALCAVAGVTVPPGASSLKTLSLKSSHEVIAQWMKGKTRRQLDALALANDIPLTTLPA